MVEWKKLGEIAEIGTGSNNREDACDKGCYPFYVRSQEVLKIDSYLYDEEAILIPGEGGVGDIFHYVNGKYGLHQRTYRVHLITDNVKGRYIYYYLFANFKTYINAKSYKSTAASIRKPMLLNFPISIPPLAQQKIIVEILDTFTSSIENLKEQIAQRRKQYEYYRDKLMDVDEGPEARLITLGEVGTFERGCGIQKKDFSEDGIGCIHYGQIHTYYGISATQTISCISKELAKKCRKAKKGDVIIATTSEDVEGCAKAVAWLGDNEICISGDSYVFHHNENPKYVAYLFQLYHFQMFKRGRCTGTKVVRISDKAMSDYTFVLPIRQKQNEIVSILDTFEETIRNLEAQLEQRQKQYEYYRNKLLTFE